MVGLLLFCLNGLFNNHYVQNELVSKNIITFEEGVAEHYIDISQFDSVKCDDECVNDIADATIDMMCDHWSVDFDILTI